jgi:hypothetical protein
MTPGGVAVAVGQTPLALPDLRLIRVRGGEMLTPEWLAVRGEEVGFAQGIFAMGERVFASTYGKSAKFRRLSKSLSKAPLATGNRNGPATAVWNPRLYELTVIAPAQEQPWPWAVLGHELRLAALQYDEATALPLPLHLAKQIEEYVYLVAENVNEDLAAASE